MLNKDFLSAFKEASPFMVGFFTVSFIFALTSINYGFPAWFAPLISLVLYAGLAQFVVLALLVAGVSVFSIVVTVFFVNLRHILMSIYMADVFDRRGFSKGFRWFYGIGITDETFAYQSTIDDARVLSYRYYLSFNIACHIAWVSGSIVGVLVGVLAQDLVTLKLDYAIVAMMIFVLVMLIDSRYKLIATIVSTLTMVLLNLLYMSHFNLFIATFIGCGVGVLLKQRAKKTK